MVYGLGYTQPRRDGRTLVLLVTVVRWRWRSMDSIMHHVLRETQTGRRGTLPYVNDRETLTVRDSEHR
jgi:hypothetical protein